MTDIIFGSVIGLICLAIPVIYTIKGKVINDFSSIAVVVAFCLFSLVFFSNVWKGIREIRQKRGRR